MSAPLLQQLYGQGRLWRGHRIAQNQDLLLPTGQPVLDQALGGGLVRGALTELLSDGRLGLSLLLPLLAGLSREARWLAWIAPPHLPYAPALAQAGVTVRRLLLIHPRADEQRLWALEQSLRSGHCSAVLAWPGRLKPAELRRLQLAAEQGNALGVLFRPRAQATQHSPATVRLGVASDPCGLRVQVLKRHGGWSSSKELVIRQTAGFETTFGQGRHGEHHARQAANNTLAMQVDTAMERTASTAPSVA